MNEPVGEPTPLPTTDARESTDAIARRIAALAAELATDLQHRDRQLEAIRRASDTLFAHPSIDAMVEATLDLALDVLRADAGTVFIHDPQRDALVFQYVVGDAKAQLQGTAIPADQGVAGTVLQTGKAVMAGNVAGRDDFNADVDRRTGFHTRSMMTAPLGRTGERPIGVMQVLNARVPFTPYDLDVLQLLCVQAATGIEHARLLASLRHAEIGNRVGEIAHDIKNMMTPIESGVLTLRPLVDATLEDTETVLGELPRETAERIRNAISPLVSIHPWLLDDLLGSANRVRRRTEYIAGMVKGILPPPEFESGSVNTPATEVVKTLGRTARERSVALVADFDPEVGTLDFDHDRLYDCLYNLVNNAIPETPEGGTVTLRTRGTGDSIVLEVEDTGRGIPEEIRSRLFTRDAVSTKKGGTGLGTAVAARVAHEHGGTIAVDSTVGKGSCFRITLPRQRPQAAPESDA
jgi:signal transduction histidine kinase